MQPNFTPTKTAGYRIAILYRLLSYFTTKRITPLGLSRGHIAFLVELFHSEEPYLSQEELSTKLEIDKAATARHIKKLIELKWVTQSPDPQNRRKNRIQLTQKALDSRAQFFSILNESNHSLTANLTLSEQQELNRLMDKMIATARTKKYENN